MSKFSELLPHDLSMSWSKKNENWSKIVGGVTFWIIAQKLEKNSYNSEIKKKIEKIWKKNFLEFDFTPSY